MRSKEEGDKPGGNPELLKQKENSNLSQCNNLEGWTQAKTAQNIGISQPAVIKAIQIGKWIRVRMHAGRLRRRIQV